ncbi:hypothetical protein CC1G_09265 [Coprinopsis cinerea okayama7|uniref:Uncharacterized protein n=1 Tax=Coprinopsis cinerea (strain Okayama-7 / 130 / ATCC MYA-4618 / FGSC 9003) TaxID=240176 RepID=A8N844_COPC7|nr:hypothetical protein CC1G_09265 [Coprinopsis cinerea okayama7\|eukprot:XP_001831000.1 hypothetical protein CC1G_09265 [Coprinopsis cinerea okayama7\
MSSRYAQTPQTHPISISTAGTRNRYFVDDYRPRPSTQPRAPAEPMDSDSGDSRQNRFCRLTQAERSHHANEGRRGPGTLNPGLPSESQAQFEEPVRPPTRIPAHRDPTLHASRPAPQPPRRPSRDGVSSLGMEGVCELGVEMPPVEVRRYLRRVSRSRTRRSVSPDSDDSDGSDDSGDSDCTVRQSNVSSRRRKTRRKTRSGGARDSGKEGVGGWESEDLVSDEEFVRRVSRLEL